MTLQATDLGSSDFQRIFGTRFAYYAGAMYKGIASKDLVIALGRSGFMGFLGTGGMREQEIADGLDAMSQTLGPDQAFGANLLHSFGHPEIEDRMIDMYVAKGVRTIEASAFMGLTEPLVRYRLQGLKRAADGSVRTNHRIIAKLSRPEVATAFLSPAPERLVGALLSRGAITDDLAALATEVPMADAICVESDSGGHTDMGSSFSQFPSIDALRDRLSREFRYKSRPLLGMAGGIGTPQAIAAAYMMGADFVGTGSVNQCTVEAGTSDAVKDMLQGIDIQDTDYAPSGDMFEIGARVQVLKKGTFFPARANKLYEIYQNHSAIEELAPSLRKQLEEKILKRSIDDIWVETTDFYSKNAPDALARAEKSAKAKMGLIFRWYFVQTTRLALAGDESRRADFQVHCGPALGAFNQIVKGTDLETWRDRNVDKVASFLMSGAAEQTNKYISAVQRTPRKDASTFEAAQ